jgi:NAD(P)H-dependent FMN reductase
LFNITSYMHHIALISASIREGRKSHRVALHLQRSLQQREGLSVDLIDLKEFDLPLFHERLKFLPEPPARAVELAERIRKANGVIMVTPEYNGGAPASLKNVIDLLTDDWKGKPVALSTVSGGAFGGSQTLVSLLFNLWKIRAWVVPGPMQVPTIGDNFNEQGEPLDAEAWAKRTGAFLDPLIWAMEATARMEKGIRA